MYEVIEMYPGRWAVRWTYLWDGKVINWGPFQTESPPNGGLKSTRRN